MKNRVELIDLTRMDAKTRASIPPDQLLELQNDLGEIKRNVERYADALYATFAARYGDTFEGEREKDTGIIHIADTGFKVSQDIKKTVKWDQKKLAAALRELKKKGEDISEYVEVSYKIPERKWAVWPSATRKQFEGSRSIYTPRPSYSIEVSA